MKFLAPKKLTKINLVCLSIQSQLLSSLEKKITEEESPTWKSFKLVLLLFFFSWFPAVTMYRAFRSLSYKDLITTDNTETTDKEDLTNIGPCSPNVYV